MKMNRKCIYKNRKLTSLPSRFSGCRLARQTFTVPFISKLMFELLIAGISYKHKKTHNRQKNFSKKLKKNKNTIMAKYRHQVGS